MSTRDLESLRRKALLMRLREIAGNRPVRKEMPAIPRAERSEAMELSFSQQRLWFIDRLEGGNAAYHIPGAVRLQGALDRACLQRALDEVVARHEVLRTVFTVSEGRPVQRVVESRGFALKEVDLSEVSPSAREALLQERILEEVRAGFDLAKGPMIRGSLLRLSQQEHVLVITMHHIVSDGWSIGILIREVAQLYAGYRAGGGSALPGLPIQYVDYAVWQQERLRGALLEEQVGYWKKQLSGGPVLLELPTDQVRPLVASYEGDSVGFELGKQVVRGLRELARQRSPCGDVAVLRTEI